MQLTPTSTTQPIQMPSESIITQRFNAVLQGRFRLLHRLLKDGRGVNCQSPGGNTLLHVAATIGNWKMVNFLLKRGANLFIKNKFNKTPIEYASSSSHEIVQKILWDSHPKSWLHSAVRIGSVSLIEFCINTKKVNVNLKDKQGKTPLHLAFMLGDVPCCNLLLKLGGDPNLANNRGETLFHTAYQAHLVADYKFFYQQGAKWVVKEKQEGSLLRFLCAVWGIGKIERPRKKTIVISFAPGRQNPLFHLAKVVNVYTKMKSQHPIPFAKEIISAFVLGANILAPPEELVKKISNKELVILRSGWDTHEVTIAFVGGYIAICSRGGDYQTQVFKIDLASPTIGILNNIQKMASSKHDIAHKFLSTDLIQQLKGCKDDLCLTIEKHPQKDQLLPFCYYISPESALRTTLLILNLLPSKKTAANPMEAEAALAKGLAQYKELSTLARLITLKKAVKYYRTRETEDKTFALPLLRIISKKLSDSNWRSQQFKSRELRDLKINLLESTKALISRMTSL